MSAEADCYRLLQEIVVKRDGICRAPWCNKPATVGHHIFKRDRAATAHDPRYSFGLCHECHVVWAHGEPNDFREWLISEMGQDEYDNGRRLSNTVVKYQDYAKIKETLERIKSG